MYNEYRFYCKPEMHLYKIKTENNPPILVITGYKSSTNKRKQGKAVISNSQETWYELLEQFTYLDPDFSLCSREEKMELFCFFDLEPKMNDLKGTRDRLSVCCN